MTPDDLHELTGVYALDALDPDEAALFEAHLEGCGACRREVRDLQEVAGALALVALRAPPPHVRERILAGIQRPAPLGPDGASRPAPTAYPARSAAVARDAAPAGATPLRARSTPRPRVVVAVAAAAVVVVLLGLAAVRSGPGAVDDMGDLGTIQDEVAATAAVVQGTDTRSIPLDGPDGASGRVLWSERHARGILVVEGLPAPGPGNVYELWYIDESPRPGPVFEPARGAVPIVGQGMRPPATFAVTIEPAGGVAAPTGPVVLSGGAGR